ncbi:efflux RND transporter periplasmic adaptor subunit [Echinimonas agarilytica]|uniref:Efflux RND transporter periplasmic adaptor subunit n=1 Tax=Echinimonas agarilytica TaxID=1215918 RepID=A0AA42B7A0_9GAMM|nr:HlyD family efflux transporter periplasmic adaptor subunit [Echinimonas agarilytica]MCM2679627.1 efflux RND transporter periplasmic adaptor subunit [Echinimonas agarilytica]
MKRFYMILAVALAILASWFFFSDSNATSKGDTNQYKTEVVSKGNILNSVSATGTLAAVDDVILGAQLSGQITKVYVDFNDIVSAGQLLAQIDPSTFAAKVAQAEAQVAKTKADISLQKIAIERSEVTLGKSERDLRRAKKLAITNNISEDELDAFQTQLDQAKLDVQQAHAQLEVLHANLAANEASMQQSQIDLSRTEIRAPIDGFVIDRTIEAGQTVASSLNTPELFTLAKDLSQMEIEAYIDESDIGQLEQGQRVSFTVDAFPDRKFNGAIKQIRRAPQNTSGVVSYTVIVSANNRSGALLPGMTANLDISIDAVQDVQRVSNAALRLASRTQDKSQQTQRRGPMGQLSELNLTEQQKLQLKEQMPERSQALGRGASEQQRKRMQQVINDVLTDAQKEQYLALKSGKIKTSQVLVLRNGEQQRLTISTGITDGQYTQVLKPSLEGEHVITQMKAGSK